MVDQLTTPTSLTRAMPDGSMQLEQSSRPVRAKQGESWVPVDTDLVASDGWWSPTASAVPVRFGAGGSDALAEVQAPDGTWVTETWPYGALPAPKVDGDTATYADVLPDVDLKLVATKTGKASIYVVKSAKAAHSKQLADLHVKVDGADLVEADGGAVVADVSGAGSASSRSLSDAASKGKALVAGAPLWWDSSKGGDYREPGGDAPMRPVQRTVASDAVSMDVGASVAAEETRSKDDTVYPIYVDPDWSSGTTAAWYTDSAYPGASYLSAGASDVLRVGNYDVWHSDMFFQFPLGALAGKQIRSAVLNTVQISVDACPAGPISSHFVSVFNPGYTWNDEQWLRNTGQMWWSGTYQQSWGPSGCGDVWQPIGWDMTGPVASQAGQPNIHFAFTGDNDLSRKHFSRDATLIVSYNSRPDTPTDPKFVSPSAPCGTASAPTVLGASDVTVSFSQTDPDPGNVDDNVNLFKASDLVNRVQWQHPGLVAQGTRSVTFTGLTDGVTYAWQARGSDWIVDGNEWTPLCYFTVRTTGPTHLPGLAVAAGPYEVGKATTATFTVDPTDGVAFIAYTVAPAPVSDGYVFDVFSTRPACGASYGEVKIACPGSNNTATVTIAPTAKSSTLWAVSYDTAGNPARVAGYPAAEAGKHGASLALTAANSPAASFAGGHVWRTLTMAAPLGGTLADTKSAGAVPLTLGKDTVRTATSNPLSAVGPQNKPVLAFADPATTGLTGPDRTSTATNAANVDGSFTVAAWLKPGSGGGAVALSAGATDAVTLGSTSTNWQFCVRNGAGTQTCVTAPNTTGTAWKHVAGVSDAVNKRLRIYVDGALMASIDRPASMPAAAGNVPVSAGAAVSGGTIASRWAGQIADPALLEGVATADQLKALRLGTDPANG